MGIEYQGVPEPALSLAEIDAIAKEIASCTNTRIVRQHSEGSLAVGLHYLDTARDEWDDVTLTFSPKRFLVSFRGVPNDNGKGFLESIGAALSKREITCVFEEE